MQEKYHALCVLSMLMIGALVGGCVDQTSPTGTSPDSQSSCPAGHAPYIRINPVDDHTIGDIFEINGTTYLGGTGKIHYFVDRPAVPVPTNSPEQDYTVASGDVVVAGNECEEMQWSFVLDTSGFASDSDAYELSVASENSETNGIFNTTTIIIRPPGASSDAPAT